MEENNISIVSSLIGLSVLLIIIGVPIYLYQQNQDYNHLCVKMCELDKSRTNTLNHCLTALNELNNISIDKVGTFDDCNNFCCLGVTCGTNTP